MNIVLDREILKRLVDTPTRWAEIDLESEASTTATALQMLVRAGLIEARFQVALDTKIRPRRLALRRHRELLQLKFRVTGSYEPQDLLDAFHKELPQHWLDRRQQTREPVEVAIEAFHEARLTDQGEVVKQELVDGGKIDVVLDRVHRLREFALSPPPQPQIVLEERNFKQIDMAESHSTQATAIAQASASVGKVVIQNHVHINAEDLRSAMQSVVETMMPQEPQSTDTESEPDDTGSTDNADGAPSRYIGRKNEADERLGDFIELRKAQYNQLVSDVLGGDKSTAFKSKFGAVAVARQWAEEDGCPDDKSEINRWATAIKSTQKYKEAIQPLNSQLPPEGWQSANGPEEDQVVAEARRRAEGS